MLQGAAYSGPGAATRPVVGHTVRRLRFLHPKRSRIEVVRGATTSSCFRFGIPTGHTSGSHSTARAISFYPALLSSSWEWKAHLNRPKACSALQSRAGEVCTATAQTRAKGGSFLFCSRCWRLPWRGPLRDFSLPRTSPFPGGWMPLPASLFTARSTHSSTNISGGTALCIS